MRCVQGVTSRKTLDQALDVRLVQGDAVDDLTVYLQPDRCLTRHGASRYLTPGTALGPITFGRTSSSGTGGPSSLSSGSCFEFGRLGIERHEGLEDVVVDR